MKKLLLATSLLLSTSAIAAPIDIIGFNAGMSFKEAIAHAESKNLTCVTPPNAEEGVKNKYCVSDINNKDDYSVIIWHSDNVENEVTDYYILIKCHMYSSCNATSKQIAQYVVNKDLVGSIEYKEDSFVNQYSGELVRYNKRYEGEGYDGDKIILDHSAIILIKGLLAETISL